MRKEGGEEERKRGGKEERVLESRRAYRMCHSHSLESTGRSLAFVGDMKGDQYPRIAMVQSCWLRSNSSSVLEARGRGERDRGKEIWYQRNLKVAIDEYER